MRLAAIFLIAIALGSAQTLPNLPAVNTLTSTSEVCTIESQDTAGGLFVQCKALTTGVITHTQVTEATAAGSFAGNGEIGCLYWLEAADKFRLQCGVAGAIKLDGYMPPVNRKRRWFLLWR